ncbi:unnamed protein product [Owenia fusiformis]|uniref:Protein Wnt n=1 Tax=Owenia fusiformis TaxID=6347 RepID=A0A8J1UGU3_OWEFU|nr:unnamed protein product [Owenia fusiformis]
MKVQGILVGLYFYLICPTNIFGLWWAVGSPLVVLDPNSICRKSKRLAGKQREICKKEPEIVREVANGAKLALKECQWQFRKRRWNCDTKHHFSRVLLRDTRETAFINAVTAAGVVYTVTQACSMGHLMQCSCESEYRDISKDDKWVWGGCGDNVKFGYIKSAEFMDARPKKKRVDLRTLILQHNNEAGRLAVKQNMRKECKCHGLSGTCTLKTCWRKMPIFRHVGNIIKKAFDSSAKVQITNDGKRIIPEKDSIKRPTREDLVYSEKSPSYCNKNRKYGSLGTRGRECDPNHEGVGGCGILCCNRGYTKNQITVRENCKCRFHWCCEVICETCVTKKTVHKCN